MDTNIKLYKMVGVNAYYHSVCFHENMCITLRKNSDNNS